MNRPLIPSRREFRPRAIPSLVLGVLGSLVTATAWARGEGLRFLTPAEDSLFGWENASLPLGNGWFGANVWGIVDNERIQISHAAVLNRGFLELNGKRCGGAVVSDTQALRIRFDGAGDVTDYERTLDFATALATVKFTRGGVRFVREYFMSHPDKVLVMRFTADRPKAISFTMRVEIPPDDSRRLSTRATDDALDTDQNLFNLGEKIASRARVVGDGRVSASGETLRIDDASEAVVYFALDTNYRLDEKMNYSGPDPRAEIESRVERAVAKGYAAIRRDHLADYTALYGRVDLELPDIAADRAKPTDRLVRAAEKGRPSVWLEQCLFQYGRYLLISSSRKGALPPHLQGVWNAFRHAPFTGNYYNNLNVQMDYWQVFVCNLAECFEAYADYHRAFRPHGNRRAREYLKMIGDPIAEPMEPTAWGMGIMTSALGGGSMTTNNNDTGMGVVGFITEMFADWWEFTRDRKVLEREVYPVVRGAADFLTRTVVETNGLYLTRFSPSPEQNIWVEDPKRPGKRICTPNYYMSTGNAFDQEMIYENNLAFLRYHEMLGKPEDALVRRVRRQINGYDPLMIGTDGQLKEFREERRYGEIGDPLHRHLSHLIALYPGSLINDSTPEYREAARISMVRRGSPNGAAGWGYAHRIGCWARLGEGERAQALLEEYEKVAIFDNLWNRHGRRNIKPEIGVEMFQIDGNFGMTAGIAEMLVQSREGVVKLLPALPKAWAKAGRFRGLRVRGGWQVDCEWRDGKVTRVNLCKVSDNATPKPKLVSP